MNGGALKESLQVLSDSMSTVDSCINTVCKGKRVRITSKFNGQEIGRSKPPLTGHIFTVTHAFYDAAHVVLWLDMDRGRYSTNAVGLEDVEFVE